MKSEQSCAKCGETRGYLLDYHHLDPSIKEAGIARMTSNNYRLDSVFEEIKKCVVLCANCHREFHYLEHQENLSIDDYLHRD